jgi:hypothetical protein
MRRALAIAFACALLMSAAGRTRAEDARADAALPTCPAPDDSRAGMCDAFDGLAFTFCVALCEARECDLLDPADARCTLLRRGFERVSDGAVPPCADGSTAL